MNKENQTCCELMASFLQDSRIPIRYLAKFREFYLPLQKSAAAQCIFYCPWCGTKLPHDLRDYYFEVLENEYGIDNDIDAQEAGTLPEEFKTDQWWKKRGL